MPDVKLFLSQDALVSREHTATSVGWTSDDGLLGDDPPGGWTQQLLLCAVKASDSLRCCFDSQKGKGQRYMKEKQPGLSLHKNLSLSSSVELSERGTCWI